MKKKNRLTPHEEQQILLECIEHNRCTQLVRQYFNLVLHAVRSVYIKKGIRFTSEDIEDRQQEVFEKLFENNKKKLRQYEQKDTHRLDRWICLIATQTVLNHLRKKKEMLDNGDFRIPLENFDKAFGEKSEDKLDAREKLLRIKDAAEKLPPPYDLVLKLDWFYGQSPKEISETLGRPVKAIYEIKSRAIKKIEHILEEIGKE